MILKSLEVANFRKFRDPLKIDGFTSGFNIVVEPNETGKSTLLEALRAAFFIRHSAKTELVRSYIPMGDEVAPRVAVEFELNGASWSLEKQFMKSHFARLTGPDGSRRESDAAEEALQELLGFERGNNRGSDPETRGPLGMLWVEQASALEVTSPNRIVRDTVRGVLEAEVGAVTGGRRFDVIRERIETAYSALRTARSGQARGELKAAEERLAAAIAERHSAEVALSGYEAALNELEGARASLKIIERDLADAATQEERNKLSADLQLGETAQARLTAAEAQYNEADAIVATTAARLERLDAAEIRLSSAAAERETMQLEHDRAKASEGAAGEEERTLRQELANARAEREQRETSLQDARTRAEAFARAAGAERAREAFRAFEILKERADALTSEIEGGLSAEQLAHLSKLEQVLQTARARFEAGSVKIDFELAADVGLRIDDEASDARSVEITTATRLTIGEAGSLVVRPPEGSGRSLEADLEAARAEFEAELRSLGVASYPAAMQRVADVEAGKRELASLVRQIEQACPGDATIGLAPGADALSAFVVGLPDEAPKLTQSDDNVEQLGAALGAAKVAEARAIGLHEDSRSVLRQAEQQLATAVAELSGAVREEEAAAEELAEIVKAGARDVMEGALAEAQRTRSARSTALEKAREDAKSFDVEAIRRRLTNMERAASQANEERIDLARRIASLQATIERDGTAGPAGRVQEAKEAEAAMQAVHDRLQREAAVLELLRNVLTEAAHEASRTFLAPVTKRAVRYVERLLPGCSLTFDEELALSAVSRSGFQENCGALSRGTQEQLAVLTRLAFADLLLEDGAPVSLILDDPLVYSDDARLELMTDILQEASERMQVILLTCRSKAFRHVDANRMDLR